MNKDTINETIKEIEKSILSLKRKLNVSLIALEVVQIKQNINKMQENMFYLIEINKKFEKVKTKYPEEQLNDLIEKIYEDIEEANAV